MKLLLDTHTFIWWDSDPAQLSSRAESALKDPANSIVLSVVSVWEMVIKAQLGKLTLRLPLAEIVSQQLSNGIEEQSLAVDSLPPVHKDPFDRLLAAQSIVENLDFVTSDAIIEHNPVRVFWK